MIGYRGTFVKSNGEERTMSFVKLGDLPQGFLESVTNGGAQRNLAEGQELVWDVDANAFRIYNWNTAIGDTTAISGSYQQEGENFTFHFTNDVNGDNV